MTLLETFFNNSEGFLPQGNADLTKEFKKLTSEQTWDELSDSYDIIESKARTPKTGDTYKVLDNLKDYMKAKHLEEQLVL